MKIRVEKGKGKWKLYIIMSIYMYTRVTTCLNEIKKEVRQVNQKFKKGNIGMANMHKKQRRQDRDGLVMMAR